jgi:hypothetical protein
MHVAGQDRFRFVESGVVGARRGSYLASERMLIG